MRILVSNSLRAICVYNSAIISDWTICFLASSLSLYCPAIFKVSKISSNRNLEKIEVIAIQ